MKVLVIGSGGREHAMALKLANCDDVDTVFVAPGNPGTAECATNVAIDGSDIDALLDFAQRESVDLTVVGPEKPLVDGIVNSFRENNLNIVGPTAAAAQLEGSKAFAKAFMDRNGIPTAAFATFNQAQYDDAAAYLSAQSIPVVIKASGLAAGKGAVVCDTREHAEQTLQDMLLSGSFGEASNEVVIEEFMVGEEASMFALCDGENYILLPSAQDHKQIGEGDTGPNTGGMGAYSPAPVVTDDVVDQVRATIIDRVLIGMANEGAPFTGFLFVGLMMTSEGPKVVEFNCRMGDPETQVVLPLIESDFADLLFRSATRSLANTEVRISRDAAACVVLVSGGYPGSYPKGHSITGIDEAQAINGVTVIQAGTRLDGTVLVTAGGRVINVVGLGDSLSEALSKAYAGIAEVNFEGAQFRRDIGLKGLKWLGVTA